MPDGTPLVDETNDVTYIIEEGSWNYPRRARNAGSH